MDRTHARGTGGRLRLCHRGSPEVRQCRYIQGSGEVREGLVQEILSQIPAGKIIWEAPQKEQQLYFIRLIGPNVNLGNIAPSEVIPLESMRLGLMGDGFDFFLTHSRNLPG